MANLDDAMPVIIDILQRSGAPVGSQLLGSGGVIREFGEQQSVEAVLRQTPIGQNARVVIHATRDSGHHRTVRLSRY